MPTLIPRRAVDAISPVQVECSYFGVMPLHLVEYKMIGIRFDELRTPETIRRQAKQLPVNVKRVTILKYNSQRCIMPSVSVQFSPCFHAALRPFAHLQVHNERRLDEPIYKLARRRMPISLVSHCAQALTRGSNEPRARQTVNLCVIRKPKRKHQRNALSPCGRPIDIPHRLEQHFRTVGKGEDQLQLSSSVDHLLNAFHGQRRHVLQQTIDIRQLSSAVRVSTDVVCCSIVQSVLCYAVVELFPRSPIRSGFFFYKSRNVNGNFRITTFDSSARSSIDLGRHAVIFLLPFARINEDHA